MVMKIKIRELKKLLTRITERYVSKKEAEYFAAEVVETDIRKMPRNGYEPGIIHDIQSWKSLKKVL